MIEYSIPDFTSSNFLLNTKILELYRDKREIFYDNVNITSIYGSFPCVWNGGRVINGPTPTPEEIKDTINTFNNMGCEVRFTCTNKFIDEKSIYDTVGNTILKNLSSSSMQNSVTVNSPLMMKYVKEKYPRLKLVLSTTLKLENVKDINSYSEHLLVIPSYTINNKFEIIDKLKYPENVEFLIGEACIDTCPNRFRHHELCSRIQALLDDYEPFQCPYGCTGNFNFYDTVVSRDHYISYNNICENYLSKGFNKFKISGRTDGQWNNIERYVHWMIKDIYKDWCREELLRTCLCMVRER